MILLHGRIPTGGKMKPSTILFGLACLLPCSLLHADEDPNINATTFHQNLDNFIHLQDRNLDTGAVSKALMAGAYMAGVADATRPVGVWCPPAPQSRMQTALIVLKYMDENPTIWDRPSYQLIGTALLKAYPCQSK
jgi:hypothetical protein